MILRAKDREIVFPRPVMLMGILNVTPDSFFDGGRYLDPSRAVEHGLEMASQGAEIIDVGGESTRPGAAQVPLEEELNRVLPVLTALAGKTKAILSIDTQKVEVARQALQAGAAIVNDIGANREDPRMWEVVAEGKAGYVAMHMQGTPQTMQSQPAYDNVVEEVAAFFENRLRRLGEAGVAPDQVVLDVGIGFGKTVAHNLELLRGLEQFKRMHRPLLLGVSRKSFMGKLLGLDIEQRLASALVCSFWAAQQGVQIIRTHDVAPTAAALRMGEALLQKRSERGNSPDPKTVESSPKGKSTPIEKR